MQITFYKEFRVILAVYKLICKKHSIPRITNFFFVNFNVMAFKELRYIGLTSLFPIGTYVTMARTPYFPNRHISDDG